MADAPYFPTVLPYEQRFKIDRQWAWEEGDRHFQHDSSVFKTMHRLALRLDAMDVPYAVAGGMALNAHGYRRLTIDLDILVTAEGRDRLHSEIEGMTYSSETAGRKRLRDVENGVGIDLLITGKFPGDAKPKPVAFPDPSAVGVEIWGVRFLSLPSLVELKLASGMTNFGRMRDLADVVEVIQILRLPVEFANELNPYVRDKFREFWWALQEAPVGPVEPWPDEIHEDRR